MTPEWPSFVASAARWLGAGALDGTLFAAGVWLVSGTLLRRATGRVLSLVWLVALVQFALVRPFQAHPVQLRAGVYRTLEASTFDPRHAWLAALYAACVLFLLLRMLVRQRRLRRRVAAFASAEPALVEYVRAAARKLSLAHLPDVRVTDAPLGPFTLGPARSTLVLPRWLCEPGARLDAVLLHELAHLARRDHWVMWFERGIATLFFFWPPVRWVSRKLDEARELACDERAIQRGGFSAADYGRHLVDVVARAREQLALGGVLAIGQGSFRLERRIDRLLQEAWARNSRWWASCWQGAVLGLLVVASLFGIRPARDLTPALAAALSAPATPSDTNISLDLSDSLNMSLPEPCVPQSCGTPCVP
jgi:beta-lactamase regulating signal transducer with metallopeptidase domain